MKKKMFDQKKNMKKNSFSIFFSKMKSQINTPPLSNTKTQSTIFTFWKIRRNFIQFVENNNQNDTHNLFPPIFFPIKQNLCFDITEKKNIQYYKHIHTHFTQIWTQTTTKKTHTKISKETQVVAIIQLTR